MTVFEMQIIDNMMKNGTATRDILDYIGSKSQEGEAEVSSGATEDYEPIRENNVSMNQEEILETLKKQGEIIKSIQARNVQKMSVPAPAVETLDTIIQAEFIDPLLKSVSSRKGVV